jgi:hypothetical protein
MFLGRLVMRQITTVRDFAEGTIFSHGSIDREDKVHKRQNMNFFLYWNFSRSRHLGKILQRTCSYPPGKAAWCKPNGPWKAVFTDEMPWHA